MEGEEVDKEVNVLAVVSNLVEVIDVNAELLKEPKSPKESVVDEVVVGAAV
jgi:hypothetical protein